MENNEKDCGMKLLPLLDDFTPAVYERGKIYDHDTHKRCALGHLLIRAGATPPFSPDLAHSLLGLTDNQINLIIWENDQSWGFGDKPVAIPILERIRRVKTLVASIDKFRRET